MPSTITHAYIGLDTLNKLNDEPKKIIKKNINNYKIYCQSMDVLYFYHLLLLVNNNVIDLGHRFHREKTYEVFELLINDNKKNKDLELFTFISGLITHYIADSFIHPYINYLEYDKYSNTKFKGHFEVETYIDNYYIREKLHVNYKKYNNAKFVFNYKENATIKEELDKLYKNIFNYHNMGKKYYRALKEMKFVYNYIRYDKYGIKKKIYQFIDFNPIKNIPRVRYLSYHFNLDNDLFYLNLNHRKWYNVDNKKEVSNKSFLDLYNDVTDEASFIINELYEYIFNNKEVNLKSIIKNNSYANGLPLSLDK